MSRVKNGKDMGLEPCPHCGKNVEFFISGNTAWNKRCADQNALVKALEYLDKFRDEIYQQTQNEDSERWSCCIDTLDEALDKARMFVL